MKQKTQTKTGRALLILALASFCAATVEGFIYYAAQPNLFFRVLLIIQNSIKSFFFQSSISLDGALGTIKDQPGVFKTVAAYAYGVALFTAPYCTAATIYRIVDQLFHLMARIRMGKAKEHAVVFGYNDDVKALLARVLEEPDTLGGRKLHLVCADELPQEERYKYYKAGWLVHTADTRTLGSADAPEALRQWGVDKSSILLLMEEDPVANFDLLQLLGGTENGALLRRDGKIYCRCEDDGIRRLIEDYYDSLPGSEKPYDLELFDITELQVREMYRAHPLHSYYWTGPDGTPPAGSKPQDWKVHLLLLGFGKVGQKALLQAMSLGITASENPILVDVVDYCMEEKTETFSVGLREEVFDMERERCEMKPSAADGSLTVRYHRADVRQLSFRRLLEKLGREDPFTYVVISMEDGNASVRCTVEVQQYLLANGSENTPVVLRMDTNRCLSNYLEENGQSFRNVHQMPDRAAFLRPELLFGEGFDRSAKEFNRFYSQIRINQGISQDDVTADAETLWRSLSLFQRNSSRALAYHQSVKERIIPCLATPEEEKAALERLLVQKDGSWSYPAGQTDGDYLQALDQEPFALEMSMLEHRRWCCYMASVGWATGDRNNLLRRHPCLTDWATLTRRRPDTCVYDLLPLMARHDQGRDSDQE